MNWSDAVRQTGFAMREMTQGKVSVKEKNSRQWTVSWEAHDNLWSAEEIKAQYHYMADKIDSWKPLNLDSEYAEAVLRLRASNKIEEVVNQPVIIQKIHGIRHSIRVAYEIRDHLIKNAEQLKTKSITDSEFEMIFKDIANRTKHLLEML